MRSFYDQQPPFEILLGKTLTEIYQNQEYGQDTLIFETSDGEKFKMHHEQDCCEDVSIEDICGDLKDLLNTPILQAEVATNNEDSGDGSETWTFYKLSTINGSVTIRWYGVSNGYYSESVDFERM